jgi:hypothetical protein
MIVRKLLKYEWSYINSTVVLQDRLTGKTFSFPISYADSLSRALIAFKNQYRIELLAKAHKTTNSIRLSKANIVSKMAEKYKKVQSILLANKQVKKQKIEAQPKLI